MVRNFLFYLLLILMSCESHDIKPTDNQTTDEDETLEQGFELLLEGSNFTDLCGIVKIDSSKNSYHIYFDRNSCQGNIKRDGEIEVTLIKGTDWTDKNAEMEISYLNYTFENQAQQLDTLKMFFNKRTISGTQRVLNVSGGVMSDFLKGKLDYLKRKTIGENMSVNYNNNPNAYRYNELWVKEMRRNDEQVSITTRGDTTLNGYAHVQEWGVDIYNQRFYKVIELPIVRTLCNQRWKYTQGVKILYSKDQYSNSEVKSKTFGVDSNGNPEGTCNSYGFKVTLEKSDEPTEVKIYKY